MQNREGQKVPQVTFRTRSNGQWKDVTTDELFKGKNVVVFALPGAYTPDLLDHPPAALQRARAGVQRATASTRSSASRSTTPS